MPPFVAEFEHSLICRGAIAMRSIGALIFPGFELLDVFGPLEMFGLMQDRYDLHLVAEQKGPVKSNQSVAAHASRVISEPAHYDIVFVPGGAGTRSEVTNAALLTWIAETSRKAEYTVSVCTGSALLAKAGILDGYRATTNKAAFDWVAEQGPGVQWQRSARWVEDGPFFTSSGVSAGMDMALGAIARMHGRDVAVQVARVCEYHWQEDSTRDPFAEMHGLI